MFWTTAKKPPSSGWTEEKNNNKTHHNNKDDKDNHSTATMNNNVRMIKKKMFPPRSSSSSSSSRTNKRMTSTSVVVEENVVSSPESPDHPRPLTTTREDLSFSSLDEFFRASSSEKKKKKSFGGFFRRKKKLLSVDVASVGNASDTMVSVTSQSHMSGRDLHEKAKMHFNDGDYLRALPLFEKILSAQVRRFSPLHPSVGAAMHNVGVCRLRLGQHTLAENLFQEAVQIRQQTLGRDHLDVAASLSKMGTARVALGKLDQAHDNMLEALQIARDNNNNNNNKKKMVAQILGHLGCFYFEAGELYASQATFQEALALYRAIWPTETDRDACMAQLTDTLCNVGSIQNRRKRFTQAIESFSEALDLQRGILGHDDPRVIATLDNLGYAYSKHKDYVSALSCYRKLLRAQISRNGTFTDECYESFRKQLLMYEKLQRIDEAIRETKEILQLQKSMLRHHHRHHDDVLITKTLQLLKNLKKKKDRLFVK